MKAKVKIETEVEIKTLHVSAGVRYWEDSSFNDKEDTEDGELVPLRNKDYWEPVIDIETGIIQDWPKGTTARIHYKVCDDGVYTLKDSTGKVVMKKDGYVPACLSPKERNFGDYVILDIDENGKIDEWEFTHNELEQFE
jgi:hypothetical protein